MSDQPTFMKILTERARPKSLDQVVLLERIEKAIGTGEFLPQHYLFQGPAGTGKCVSADTKITIRNKANNSISTINISELLE